MALVNESYVRNPNSGYSCPVTLAQAKAQLNITGNYHNDYINTLIVAATELCESETWRCFLEAEYTCHIGKIVKDKDILLFRNPIQSIDSVKYYNTLNVLTTLTNGVDYIYSLDCEPAVLKFLTIPSVSSTKIYPIQVAMTCGWASSDLVPQRIKQAILMAVANMYEMRNDAVVGASISIELPMASKRLLQNCRVNTY